MAIFWQIKNMLKEFITNYVILPLVFIVLYGGMVIAAIRQRMREEDRAMKLGF